MTLCMGHRMWLVGPGEKGSVSAPRSTLPCISAVLSCDLPHHLQDSRRCQPWAGPRWPVGQQGNLHPGSSCDFSTEFPAEPGCIPCAPFQLRDTRSPGDPLPEQSLCSHTFAVGEKPEGAHELPPAAWGIKRAPDGRGLPRLFSSPVLQPNLIFSFPAFRVLCKTPLLPEALSWPAQAPSSSSLFLFTFCDLRLESC